MNKVKDEYLEYRDDVPKTILDFNGLRKDIQAFKVEKAVDILMRFYDIDWICNGKQYSRFLPTTAKNIDDTVDTGTHNIGIFSTALCLETIASYARKVEKCKNIDGKLWVWDHGRDQRVLPDRRRAGTASSVETERQEQRAKVRRTTPIQHYGKEKAYSHFRFIINGLYGDFDASLGFLARIATLVRFGNYLSHWGIKEGFIEKADDEIKAKFYEICTDCIYEFHDRLLTKREGIHPFELYRFLQFVRKWGNEIGNYLVRPKKILATLTKTIKEGLGGSVNLLNEQLQKHTGAINKDDVVFRYFFEEVYLFAKYELYRQLSLKESGDSRLYDAKRLIYALLIVYLDNRFSNTLIRRKALELIFSPYRDDRNAIWPTGQQVAMSKDGLMIVSDNECVCDLLGCEHLSTSLLDFVPELKCIYDGYARTKRVANGKIKGWYPVHQRDQTPTSWTTALTLSFVKRFCKLISLELARKAKDKFRSNYRKPDIEWGDIYDCTAVKAKIRLMFPENYGRKNDIPNDARDVIRDCRYRTAILFGPPGTGKTTYGRAMSTKLKLDYLELTPGDFFSGGEDSILVTINDIFEHLLHLRNTVVFIDEIDDLVKDRNQKPGQPYDRRTLFVNSLLPRFQELHDKGNIILLMATNNIERVDEAISRLGRVDLVIPVGAISPHGRLKFLHKFCNNHKELLGKIFRLPVEDKLALVIEYLNATEAFNYGILKHYLEMIIDEVRKIQFNDANMIRTKIVNLLQVQAKKKDEKNPQLIWAGKVIKKGHEYDTRPRHIDGDFQDFGHFSLLEFPNFKIRFQNAFIQLYFNLNCEKIDVSLAKEIEGTISTYCNDFLMEEKSPQKSQSFDRPLSNIMTPFFDDIEKAIEMVIEEDKDIKKILKRSREHIEKLIFRRAMLPE